MNLQTYAKIGICSGIAAIVIFSVIAVIGASDDIRENWMRMTIDKDKMMEKMKVLPSVMLFTEKYEDHYYQEHKRYRGVGIELRASNFETESTMRLDVNYDMRDERIEQRVRCDVDNNQLRKILGSNSELDESSNGYLKQLLKEGRAEDNYTRDFIEFTNCLEIGSDPSDVIPQIVSPEYGDLPTYTISVPQGSAVPGCEEIAHCFEPEEITIKVGEIIEWKNYDDAMHTITSGDPNDGPTGLFDSGLAEPDATYALKFNTPGEYPYFCMVHPWQEGMITVTE